MQKIVNQILTKLFWGGLRHILSDKQYARFRYRIELGVWPDIRNPQKFSEKIQFIKLFQRNELRRRVADRHRVRSYVTEKAGSDLLIPLIDHFPELTKEKWDQLTNQFVLKANHGCGMVKIVTDKPDESFSEIRSLINDWQKTDYYRFGREWVYKDLPRTILAEQLLENTHGDIPNDYKFFCFHGKVEVIQIDFDRFGHHTRNLYGRNFNLLPATIIYPNNTDTVQKHPQLDSAINVAEKLSKEFDFIRVDLFLLKNRVCFGELTNYPGNGFAKFEPASFDEKLGRFWKLSIP